MPRAEWRSQAAYDDLRSLDAPGFAWQFLNRNLDFERDWKRLARASEHRPLVAIELDRFAQRWGVISGQAKPARFFSPSGRRRAYRA
jgi:Family of unknown function (DUF6499)